MSANSCLYELQTDKVGFNRGAEKELPAEDWKEAQDRLRVGAPRGYVGLSGSWVSLPLAWVRRWQLRRLSGILVLDVMRGSPAARSRLIPGDVILGAGWSPLRGVDCVEDIQAQLVEECIGVPIVLWVFRRSMRFVELVMVPVIPVVYREEVDGEVPSGSIIKF